MLDTANQDNQSHRNNSRSDDDERIQRQLLECVRDARQYIKDMTKLPGSPEQVQAGSLAVGLSVVTSEELQYDPMIDYYNEFWRVYTSNERHLKQMQLISNEMGVLRVKLTEIEDLQERRSTEFKNACKKKTRRLAVDIDKKHRCPYDNCYKLYGSNVSLNLHIKLKHNGGNKTDREKLAICIAEMNRAQLPSYTINFPPGFLESYRREFAKSVKKEIRA